VVVQLAGRTRRPGTIPVEIWDHVKASMSERNWSDKEFALATNTRFDGPPMWTHAPGRSRLHRLSNIFADSTLHDLATNDIYWDKVVDVASRGRRALLDFSDDMSHPVMMRGVLLLP
jgi:replicative DNA helicase